MGPRGYPGCDTLVVAWFNYLNNLPLLKNHATYISLKLSVEFYENVSKFCLVMANGSCPLPHWECLQAQGTFCRHILCPTGSVLEQGVTLPYHPESTGKQWDAERGTRKVEWREGMRGKPLLLSRKVTVWDKAHGGNTPTYSPQAQRLVMNWHNPKTAFDTKGAKKSCLPTRRELSSGSIVGKTTRPSLFNTRLQAGPGWQPTPPAPGLCLTPCLQCSGKAKARMATSLWGGAQARSPNITNPL